MEEKVKIERMPNKLVLFLRSLLQGFDDLIKMIVKEAIIRGLKEAYAKNPLAVKTAIGSFYPIVDGYLETAAKKTETLYDDDIIIGLKEALEDFATEIKLTLSNVDSD